MSPDLFVVCKNCGSEVSPYVTECPYCGARLRKRAPKLSHRRRQLVGFWRRGNKLDRLRPGEIPGIKADTRRPYGTIMLVLTAIVMTLAAHAEAISFADVVVFGSLGDEFWRGLTTLFVYDSTGYEIAALTSVALFGWLTERRFGSLATIAIFLLGGFVGVLVATNVADLPVVAGANGGGLALLCAWSIEPLRARRRGRPDDADLLGTAAFALLLILMPIVVREANVFAGIGGALVGCTIGGLAGIVLRR